MAKVPRRHKIAKKFRRQNLKKSTRAERKFEYLLKKHNINYQKQFVVMFSNKVRKRTRTQKSFYILDFYLPGDRIGIEIDGESHNNKSKYDIVRDKEIYFYAKTRVIRFTNTDVFMNPEMTMMTLLEFIETNKRYTKKHKPLKKEDICYPQPKKGDGTILGFYL